MYEFVTFSINIFFAGAYVALGICNL